MTPTTLIDRAYHRATLAGWVGVDLFFVLSGFLISGILLDSKGSSRFFRTFYARRVLRIFPLYYGFLCIIYLVLPHLVTANEELQQLTANQKWFWLYLQNVQIARDHWPEPQHLTHFWSLAVEEQFYLIWPLLVCYLGRRGFIAVCLACIASSPLLRIVLALRGEAAAAYVLMPARMDALAVGALLAVIARGAGGLARCRRCARVVASACALLLILYIIWTRRFAFDALLVQTAGYSLLALLFGSLLTIAVTGPPRALTRRVLSAPVLVFFGRYSYGMYVLHNPLLVWIRGKGFNANSLPTMFGSQLPGELLFATAGMAATVTLALLSWYCLEKPLLHLKRWFVYEQSRPLSVPGPLAD